MSGGSAGHQAPGEVVANCSDVRAMVLIAYRNTKNRVPALFAGFADANPAQGAWGCCKIDE